MLSGCPLKVCFSLTCFLNVLSQRADLPSRCNPLEDKPCQTNHDTPKGLGSPNFSQA